ncbi:hypothetical protein [Actinoallomurus sp. NPDC052274]|uniref:hypothetical protein n=1 Tax=Actinoallomurus sp. NPDC052274 TaxID=3155420 RepID=UPI0034393E88
MIEHVRSYEGLGQKFTFGDELAEVEQAADELTGTGSDELADTEVHSELWRTYSEMAETAPSAAIMGVWSEIEKSARRLAMLYGIDKKAPGNLFRHLIEVRIIPGSMLKIIDRLRILRNRVAHGDHEPTAGEALTYVSTANEVSTILRKLEALVKEEPRKDSEEPRPQDLDELFNRLFDARNSEKREPDSGAP